MLMPMPGTMPEIPLNCGGLRVALLDVDLPDEVPDEVGERGARIEHNGWLFIGAGHFYGEGEAGRKGAGVSGCLEV